MKIFTLYQIISLIEFIFGLCYIYLQNDHVITLYWLFGATVTNFIIMILITIYKDLDKLMVESEKH
jgi:hypothetical protein